MKLALDHRVRQLFNDLQPDSTGGTGGAGGALQNPGSPPSFVVEARAHPCRTSDEKIGSRLDGFGYYCGAQLSVSYGKHL